MQTTAQPTVQDVPLVALRPAPHNPRRISEDRLEHRSLEADREMLRARPLIAPPDGTVVGGDQRLRAAMALNRETVPAVYVDFGLPCPVATEENA